MIKRKGFGVVGGSSDGEEGGGNGGCGR